MNRKICVVTGSRADYGLLYWVIRLIQEDPDLSLQILATGAHLSPNFGLTYKVIEGDGFQIDEKVEMLLSSDTSVGIAKSMGLGIIGFADAFERLKPDIIVVLGDRYEILAVSQAALIFNIPLAHIAGGDTTEGAFDEAIRHSITKMSHLHFVTNQVAAHRVRQLGENPEYIYNFGSPGIDGILRLKLLTRDELSQRLNFKFRDKNLLITYHPETLDSPESNYHSLQELLKALDRLGDRFGLIFTHSNSDPMGQTMSKLLENYAKNREHAAIYTSLGQLLYFSTIAQVDAAVGNSSSGLYEVPSFQKPTVNIGNRQKGRIQASSVISCLPQADRIEQAIQMAMNTDCSQTVNPYGDGRSSDRIVKTLKNISNLKSLSPKRFFDMNLD